MLDNSLQGGFSNPPVQSAQAFRAALSAMARPGRIETLGGATAPAPTSAAAATLLLTLCDQETPLFLGGAYDTLAMRDWISFHIGAPIVEAGFAQYALGTWADLSQATLPTGISDYPDRSATLIVEMDTLAATGARLTGPGIEVEAHLNLPEIKAFQANRALFPLGLDFYFTAGPHLAGLPRSSIVAEL